MTDRPLGVIVPHVFGSTIFTEASWPVATVVWLGERPIPRAYRRAGFHAAVWSTMEEVGHQPNEYCVISNLINDTQVFAHIFTQQENLA
jgi:hypothetical protein